MVRHLLQIENIFKCLSKNVKPIFWLTALVLNTNVKTALSYLDAGLHLIFSY